MAVSSDITTPRTADGALLFKPVWECMLTASCREAAKRFRRAAIQPSKVNQIRYLRDLAVGQYRKPLSRADDVRS